MNLINIDWVGFYRISLHCIKVIDTNQTHTHTHTLYMDTDTKRTSFDTVQAHFYFLNFNF